MIWILSTSPVLLSAMIYSIYHALGTVAFLFTLELVKVYYDLRKAFSDHSVHSRPIFLTITLSSFLSPKIELSEDIGVKYLHLKCVCLLYFK